MKTLVHNSITVLLNRIISEISFTTLILLFSYSYSTAQVSNDLSKYYQYKSVKYYATQKFDCWDGVDYPTFLIKSRVDQNGSSDYLMNWEWDVASGQDICIDDWDGDVSGTTISNASSYSQTHLLEENFNGTSNMKIDLECQMFNNNTYNAIGGQLGSRCIAETHTLYSDDCKWYRNKYLVAANINTEASCQINSQNLTLNDNGLVGAIRVEKVWRYEKGQNWSNALKFGTIIGNKTVEHTNSNRSNPSGYDSRLGYANNVTTGYVNGQNTPDVSYSFNIPEGTSKKVTISTDYSETNFDSYIHLYRWNPNTGSYSSVESDDDHGTEYLYTSKLTHNLCGVSGLEYLIIVEGADGALNGISKTGDFKLTLKTENIPESDFTIGTITPPYSSACSGRDIGPIDGTAGSVDIFGAGNVSYVWQVKTGASWGPEITTTTSHLPMSESGSMGTTNVEYRRRVVRCSATTSAWANASITYEEGEATAAGSIALAIANNSSVPTGFSPGTINSTGAGAVNPGPIVYQWQKKEGTGVYEDIPNANGLSYTVPSLTNNTGIVVSHKFRRKVSSECGGDPLYAAGPAGDFVEILVVPVNGEISGEVLSPIGAGGAGAPVPGVDITIERLDNVAGDSFVPDTYTATTGSNGKYTITGIYYGSSQANFRITPSKIDGTIIHEFNPTSIDEILTNAEPAFDEGDFVDETTFTFSGKVYQDFNGSFCGMDTVGIYLNNLAVDSTDSEGNYAISIPSIGNYTVEARFGNGHSFDPAQYMEFIDGDRSGKDFKNIEMNTVNGFAGGNCNTNLGIAKIRFTSLDGCIVEEKTTQSSGNYVINLPANIYDVQLFEFPNPAPYTQGDVEAYFNGSVRLNLLEKDTDKTLDFIYRPPPVVRVTGWPDPLCNGGDIIVDQLEPIELTLEIFEGVLDGCKVDTGRFIITDVVSDSSDHMLSLPFKDGVATYTVVPGLPHIIFPYRKNLNIVGKDTINQSSVAYSQDVVVTGARPREQDFVTVTPELPTLILRDPPGDASYSCVEVGQTNEVTTRMYTKKATEASTWGEVKVGTEFEAGIGFSIETEIESTIKGTLDITDSAVNTSEYIRTISSSTRYCTSDQNLVTGDTGGDVYIGGAMNMLYAIADIIFIDENCNVVADEELVIKNEGYATEYIYTEKYIKDILFNKLQNLQENAATEDSAAWYAMQIDVWEQVLQRNQDLKDKAIPWEGNVSFSSNAPHTHYSEVATTESLTIEFMMEIDEGIATAAGVEIGGIGASGGVNAVMKMETGESETNTTLSTFRTEYHLNDNNDGGFADDGFSVDILTDPVYKTPVFKHISSNTSCPWEPGSQPRDVPRLTVVNPVVTDIPLGQVGEFTLILENISESEEDRTYFLQIDPLSNPNNATVTVGGAPFPGDGPGLPYPLSYLQSFPLDISVAQGTSTVYSYEGIRFRLYPLCEAGADGSPAELASEAIISAFFDSPCSDVGLFEPVDGWEINSNSNMLNVHIKDYTKSQLDQIQVEFAPTGTSNFQSIKIVDKQDLNNSNPNGTNIGTEVDVDVTNIPEGEIDIRLKLVCGSTSIFSTRASGTIDRLAPNLLGLPEPSDDDFESGDEISVYFDEEIVCDPINTTVELLNLVTGVPVNAVVTCFENKASITPIGVNLANLGDAIYQVTVSNISDVYGNVSEDVVWDFRVGEYVYVCAPAIQSGNDICSHAIPISCGETVSTSNNCAAEISLPDCAANPNSTYTFKGLWYSFTGDGNDMTLSSCDEADFNTVIMVYEGTCGNVTCYAATEGTCEGLGTEVTFSTVAGNSYYVAIAGFYTGAIGNFEMTLSCGEPACPPSLDLNNVPEAGGVYTAETYISSESKISAAGGDVNYTAGHRVELIQGFEVESGVEFNAYIEGCGNVNRVGTTQNPLGGSKR